MRNQCKRDHQIGYKLLSRNRFRVPSQRCPQCQRFLPQPSRPASAKPQAEPVRILLWRAYQERKSSFLLLISRNPTSERCGCRSVADSLYLELALTTSDE